MKKALFLLQPDAMVGEPQSQPTGRTPHITIHAFCESPEVIALMRAAATDRRLSRADAVVSSGGIRAAIAFCGDHPTPDLLVLESNAARAELLADMNALAPVCDAKTKVVVIGSSNDIALYREMVANGVAEYLVAPVDVLAIIRTVLQLFRKEDAPRTGKICAFIGAKGGVGSSTIAQNVAWTMAQRRSAVMLADMDLLFGTVALNYNIESHTGFAEQLRDVDRLDEAVLDRLLFKHGTHLSVLPSATTAQETAEPGPNVLDKMFDLAQTTFPFVVLDLPHGWSTWVRGSLLAADEIVLTAEPDLANLRNARCMLDLLKQARPNDPQPRLVLNRVGMQGRNEIQAQKFAAALEIELAAKIAFAPGVFSTAANTGKMIVEVSRRDLAGKAFDQLAVSLTGKIAPRKQHGLKRFWNG